MPRRIQDVRAGGGMRLQNKLRDIEVIGEIITCVEQPQSMS